MLLLLLLPLLLAPALLCIPSAAYKFGLTAAAAAAAAAVAGTGCFPAGALVIFFCWT
jgi:hypothetical protein